MVTRKKVVKKKVPKKKVSATNRSAELVTKLRQDLRDAKAEVREANMKVRESERKIKALLKLLETTQAATDKFLASRVKDAVKKYDITVTPKRRRTRRVTKKKAVTE